jgi:hypothetical protein
MAGIQLLTGEDKVIITAIVAIAVIVLGAIAVSVFAPTVTTIITSITPAAITAISILAARHPPVVNAATQTVNGVRVQEGEVSP